MMDEDAGSGAWAIPQVSHSWMAGQFARRWGNRRVPQAAPRAEVEAAVLLHDCGWTEFDTDPGVDSEGRPVTFNRMPVATHLEVWRMSVARTAMHSRYAASLVAAHFAFLADRKAEELLERGDTTGARSTEAFRAEMERLRSGWDEELAADARYRRFLDGEERRLNASILSACDLLSVLLCASMPFGTIPVRAIDREGKAEELTIVPVGERRFKIRPWPFEGPKFAVHCEGRRLFGTRFPDGESLRKDLLSARVDRFSFEFVRPSAV